MATSRFLAENREAELNPPLSTPNFPYFLCFSIFPLREREKKGRKRERERERERGHVGSSHVNVLLIAIQSPHDIGPNMRSDVISHNINSFFFKLFSRSFIMVGMGRRRGLNWYEGYAKGIFGVLGGRGFIWRKGEVTGGQCG